MSDTSKPTEGVCAVDIGTQSVRAIVFAQDGSVLAKCQLEQDMIMPQNNYYEHDPLETIASTAEVLKNVKSHCDKDGITIKSIGITNHRESICVWNPVTGVPLHNIVLWLDTRNSELIDGMIESDGQDCLRERCGLPLSTYFSACKLKWLMENVEEVKTAVADGQAMVGTVDSWVIWNLTGGRHGGNHVTDVTNASRTMLMNIASCEWDDSLLEYFGVHSECLPKIVCSSCEFGEIKSIPELEGIPINGVLGDQQAALVAHGCFAVGEAKNTYGTGCFMLLNTGELVQSEHGLLSTVAYQFGDKPVYALEGSIAVAGVAVKWLRDELHMIHSAAEINTHAEAVEDTAGVVFVPAFSGLFAPHWRSDARGCLVGLSNYTNRGHICRAVLEASAFQTREVFDAMAADSGVTIQALSVDGGMTASDLLMQTQADILGTPVERPAMAELTALGAAAAAGLFVGFWESPEEFAKTTLTEATSFKPEIETEAAEERFYAWQCAVERSLGWNGKDGKPTRMSEVAPLKEE